MGTAIARPSASASKRIPHVVPDRDDEYKIACFGATGSGKSALALRIATTQFVGNYDPGLEDMYSKTVKIDGYSCLLRILDKMDFESDDMVSVAIQECKGFLLCYGVDSKKSFALANEMHRKIKSLKNINEVMETVVMLVSCKNDIAPELREVSSEEGKALAAELKIPFIETSAKDDTNMSKLVEELVRDLRDRNTPKRPPMK